MFPHTQLAKTMSQKSILIIGAGIAGLAAGCYAQMNGYRSQIFETHTLPGGLCTAWERQGYTFDGCIHYLFGSAQGEPFHQVWRELGAAQGWQMINHSELLRVTDSVGRTLVVHADPDRLEAHMKELSPRDEDLIEELADGVRQFLPFDMSSLQARPRALMTPLDWRDFGLQMMPFVLPLARWGMLSAGEFGRRFSDPFLRRAVSEMFAWPEIPLMAGLSLLASMQRQNAGFPAGGSLAFAQAIERRYLALGGQIHYSAQVEKILVEDDRAVGLRLYNDEIHRGDAVISAADGRATIYHLLDGRYTNRNIDRRYDESRLPLRPQLQVSLGVDRNLSAAPHWVTHLLDEPLRIGGQAHSAIGVKHYCYDPSLSPSGKSCVIVALPSDYGYWQRIYGRRLYDTEQLQVCGQIIDFLETIYPGIGAQVEVKDVATPMSYERYTGNWQGSNCGWLLTKETMALLVQGVEKTLPGLGNFYLAGQWVEPGGSVPAVAMSGRNAVQLLCAADGRTFGTECP